MKYFKIGGTGHNFYINWEGAREKQYPKQDELPQALWPALVSPTDNQVHLVLGIRHSGVICLLMTESQGENVLSVASRSGVKFKGKVHHPYEFASLSPIIFKNVEELKEFMRKLEPNFTKKRKVDRSALNRSFFNEKGEEQASEAGQRRWNYELARLVVILLMQPGFRPDHFAIPQSAVVNVRKLRICAMTVDLLDKNFDSRPPRSRLESPKVLSYSWSECNVLNGPEVRLKKLEDSVKRENNLKQEDKPSVKNEVKDEVQTEVKMEYLNGGAKTEDQKLAASATASWYTDRTGSIDVEPESSRCFVPSNVLLQDKFASWRKQSDQATVCPPDDIKAFFKSKLSRNPRADEEGPILLLTHNAEALVLPHLVKEMGLDDDGNRSLPKGFQLGLESLFDLPIGHLRKVDDRDLYRGQYQQDDMRQRDYASASTSKDPRPRPAPPPRDSRPVKPHVYVVDIRAIAHSIFTEANPELYETAGSVGRRALVPEKICCAETVIETFKTLVTADRAGTQMVEYYVEESELRTELRGYREPNDPGEEPTLAVPPKEPKVSARQEVSTGYLTSASEEDEDDDDDSDI